MAGYREAQTDCETKAPQPETLRQIVSDIATALAEANYEARELGEVLDGGCDKPDPSACAPTPFSLRQHLDSIRDQARLVARLNTVNHSAVGRIQPPPGSDRITGMANAYPQGKSLR